MVDMCCSHNANYPVKHCHLTQTLPTSVIHKGYSMFAPIYVIENSSNEFCKGSFAVKYDRKQLRLEHSLNGLRASNNHCNMLRFDRITRTLRYIYNYKKKN